MIRLVSKAISKYHPAKLLLFCYAFYAIIGWLLLMMPFCQKHPITAIDSFFTAIAAMTTTGLNTLDVGSSYSIIGQIIILLLIQVGGIGYMTFNTFVIIATTHRLSAFSKKITTAEFPLPKEFKIKEFIYHVVLFTLSCELIGAISLSRVFADKGIEHPLWNGIFHSVSAFCTAGFSLFPDSLASFGVNLEVNGIISILSILGAIGFITWVNFYKRATGEKKYVSFTAKVILAVTFWFLILGTILFFSIQDHALDTTVYHRWLNSFFQVMTATTTAGFHTIDMSLLKPSCIVLLLFLMAIGASPSGTGGGLKTTTFVALVGLVKSTIKGEKVVSFWKREIPPKRLRLATATFSYYVLVLTAALFFLLLLEKKPFLPVLFEAVSALGTIGLSMGITPSLTYMGKIVISLLMLMGKMGILTFGIAFATQVPTSKPLKKDNELVF